MKVLIIDVWTPFHIGNAALLSNSLNLIKRSIDVSKIEVSGFLPKTIEEYSGLKSSQYLRYSYLPCDVKNKIARFVLNKFLRIEWEIWKHLMTSVFNFSKKCGIVFNPLSFTIFPQRRKTVRSYIAADLVVSISGEGINECHGFLKNFIFFYEFALMLNKKIVFFPQSFGPVFSIKHRKELLNIFNKSSLVVPRDEPSFNFLKDLGIEKQKQIGIIPDVAVLQEFINRKEAAEILSHNEGIDIDGISKIVGVSISRWTDSNQAKNNFDYVNEIKKFIYHLVESEYMVILMPANFAYYDGMDSIQIDSTFNNHLCKQINSQNVKVLSRQYTPVEYKGILGLLEAFITTRMHVAILSTMVLTPTITIATQIKLRGYMKNIGQENNVIDIQEASVSRLIEKFDDLIMDHDAIVHHLTQQREVIQKDALRMIDLLKCCAENGQRK